MASEACLVMLDSWLSAENSFLAVPALVAAKETVAVALDAQADVGSLLVSHATPAELEPHPEEFLGRDWCPVDTFGAE